MLYKCHICCLRITQHIKYLTQHKTKFTQHMKKNLDNIYEILDQHLTFFTQRMKILYTTYETNLYNI